MAPEYIIPKNAYVLYCLNDKGEGEIIYPKKSKGPLAQMVEYITDLAEIEDYIRQYVVSKFTKVLVLKCIDLLSVNIKSNYKEK